MKLAHDIRGSGPILVLVHGVTHRRQAWDSLIDQLAAYRTVVTVDLPNHGQSPQLPPGPHMLTQVLEGLSEFVKELGADGTPVHIAGNSLGGWLALQLAARGEVASATALSPAGFSLGRWDELRTQKTFLGMRWIARSLGPKMNTVLRIKLGRALALGFFFAKPWRVSPENAIVDAQSLSTNTILDYLDTDFSFPRTLSKVPITVAWGSRDLILPVYQAKKVAKSFPHAKVLILPGLGHVPMTDDPELIGTILLGASTQAVET
ncbi:MAG: alpha/beta fold hydrolase [Mycobacteriaceae bacterium]